MLADSRWAATVAAAVLGAAPMLLQTATASVVSLDLSRGNAQDLSQPKPQSRFLAKRTVFSESIANNITGGGYYIDVTVGTPPQPARMVLDTGSSDAWIVSVDADLCTSRRLQATYLDTCSSTYDSSKSSTYELAERNGFEIQYLDGSTAEGDYVKDDFTIGGTTIKGLQIGVASTVVRGTGILGVGYSAHVAASEPYPNIIDSMVNQSLTPVKAYSLYLNDRRATTGTIMFGGIDTSKFISELHVLPIIPDVSSWQITSFTVKMHNVSIAFTNGTTFDVAMPTSNSTLISGTTRNYTTQSEVYRGVPALLDSGTTLTYLPAAMTDVLFEAVGAVTPNSRVTGGLTFVSCELLRTQPDMAWSFTFDSVTVKVPVYEMILDVIGDTASLLPTMEGIPEDQVCLFGIQSTSQFGTTSSELVSSNFALLGDTFLRSAYVVYDLDHNQIGLAQANLNSTDSTVVELQASATALPSGLTGVASQVANPAGGAGSDSQPENAAPGRMGSEVMAVMAVSGFFAVLGGAFVVM